MLNVVMLSEPSMVPFWKKSHSLENSPATNTAAESVTKKRFITLTSELQSPPIKIYRLTNSVCWTKCSTRVQSIQEKPSSMFTCLPVSLSVTLIVYLSVRSFACLSVGGNSFSGSTM